jgi:hypothetical protein
MAKIRRGIPDIWERTDRIEVDDSVMPVLLSE